MINFRILFDHISKILLVVTTRNPLPYYIAATRPRLQVSFSEFICKFHQHVDLSAILSWYFFNISPKCQIFASFL